MEKDNGITTIAFTGKRAERFLEQHGVAPERFVVGVAGQDEKRIETPVGKVGLGYVSTELSTGVMHTVVVDLTDVRGVRRNSAQVSIGRAGYGFQEVGKGLEIVVATSVDRTVFERRRQ